MLPCRDTMHGLYVNEMCIGSGWKVQVDGLYLHILKRGLAI